MHRTEGSAGVDGDNDQRFAAVAEEFARNFAVRGEVGASVHVMVDGETVVDLWGGAADRSGTPWAEDTLTPVFSSTKGATALCAHLLIDRGRLDLDAPVVDYWPEFAAGGKERATVAMMLDHTVGVPALRGRLDPGACCDWTQMTERIAAEEAWWEPGTRCGYHMLTFGWTVGELVRRVSGRSLGDFFRTEIAEPTGADFHIGITEDQQHRVAPVFQPTPDRSDPSEFTRALLIDALSIPRLAWMNSGGFEPNDPTVQRAQIGGGGGISNARGLARMYRPLSLGGDGLFSPEAVAVMGRVSSATRRDATLLIPTRFGLGFMVAMDNRRRRQGDRDSVILSPTAFGHVGAGGSIGFADPDCGLAFGYAMNRMGTGILLNERGQSLVDAAYRCLGYRNDTAGIRLR